MSVTVGQVLASLQERFPPEWAEPWDAVGLLVGRSAGVVERVLVTLDPTPAAVDHAVETGAGLLVTHHPAYIEAPARFTEGAGAALAAAEAGVALLAAHTNLDRSPSGGDALPAALGLRVTGPLEDGLQPCDLVTTYVPPEAADAVSSAMAVAGAGRIGMYRGCSFSTPGTGRFTPLPGSHPATGEVSTPSAAEEIRLEMIAPPGTGSSVAAAASGAHPYEEPLVIVQVSAVARGAARLGRLCDAEGRTARDIASHAARHLGCAPRVLGDLDRRLRCVAVAGGSGGSLLGSALAAGADAFVTGELRYHDALEAVERGLAVIELGHDASEWPMVPVLAEAVLATPGLSAAAVEVEPAGTLYRVL